jgi:tetratricopeptide (TPR) repeat protein
MTKHLRRHSPLRTAMIAVVMGVTMAHSGFRPQAHAQAVKAEKPGQAGLDPAAVRSLLSVRRPAAGKDARALVVLGRPSYAREIPDSDEHVRLDMLARELLRQAILITARDELGLATRDEVIGDAVNQDEPGQPGSVEVISLIRDHIWRTQIRRVVGDRVEEQCARETKTATGQDLETVRLVVAAETWSRQDFPAVLKALGLEGKPNEIKETTEPALPRYVEGRLSSLGYSQTLAAIRDLHQAIRTKGETPAALGALVRAYAQLGVLSEFHWHSAHRAFKARALLYAQRLLVRAPDRPWSLWHRAFALALAGRHRDAVADHESARKIAGAGKDVPAWIDLIDAYARCDTRRLQGQKDPVQNLAVLLRMIALEYPAGKAVNVQTSRAVLELAPLCFRAIDVMCRSQGVSTLHVATELGPQALDDVFPQDLAALESLPASERARIDNQELTVLDLADLLDKAGRPDQDNGEPSWAALAHLIRETNFVHVWRRLDFMKNRWSVPVDEYWNEVKDDVASHRYRPYLETLALPWQVSSRTFHQFADRFDLSDVEVTAHEMMRLLDKFPAARGKAAWRVALSHTELAASEQAYMTWISAEESKEIRLKCADDLLSVSPNHPLARATLIDLAWDKVKDKVNEWEKQSEDNPAFLAAIGRRSFNDKKYEDARRALKRYIEQSPDLWAYQMVADSFKAQRDMARWRETLDDFLAKVEDLGLDHAKVRVQIAEYFMSRKEWDKATPYAENAGESWAQWAMTCAARCAEGDGRWEQAETWHKRNAERYSETSFADWYFFCKRTGHGNLAGARDFTEQYIRSLDNTRGARDGVEGAFNWLDGRLEPARAAFTRSCKPSPKLSEGLSLAVLLDAAGDAALRNKLIKKVTEQNGKRYPQLTAAIQIVVDKVLDAVETKKHLDASEVERLIQACPQKQRSFAEFCIAGFLRNHGEIEQARKLYERCADSPMLWVWFQYIAKDALKAMKAK